MQRTASSGATSTTAEPGATPGRIPCLARRCTGRFLRLSATPIGGRIWCDASRTKPHSAPRYFPASAVSRPFFSRDLRGNPRDQARRRTKPVTFGRPRIPSRGLLECAYRLANVWCLLSVGHDRPGVDEIVRRTARAVTSGSLGSCTERWLPSRWRSASACRASQNHRTAKKAGLESPHCRPDESGCQRTALVLTAATSFSVMFAPTIDGKLRDSMATLASLLAAAIWSISLRRVKGGVDGVPPPIGIPSLPLAMRATLRSRAHNNTARRERRRRTRLGSCRGWQRPRSRFWLVDWKNCSTRSGSSPARIAFSAFDLPAIENSTIPAVRHRGVIALARVSCTRRGTQTGRCALAAMPPVFSERKSSAYWLRSQPPRSLATGPRSSVRDSSLAGWGLQIWSFDLASKAATSPFSAVSFACLLRQRWSYSSRHPGQLGSPFPYALMAVVSSECGARSDRGSAALHTLQILPPYPGGYLLARSSLQKGAGSRNRRGVTSSRKTNGCTRYFRRWRSIDRLRR